MVAPPCHIVCILMAGLRYMGRHCPVITRAMGVFGLFFEEQEWLNQSFAPDGHALSLLRVN